MAPQWMPQNIQKRLLLYVLQQLSLFSGIDIENLEVSLGSKSQVQLNDVDIDTDAFKIPGIHLRNGSIKNLLLNLNMSGGVNFEIDGLFITMALAYTSNNLSDSILTEHSKETLTQSTIDLAQSLIQDLPLDQTIDEGTENKDKSTLNSVMSKAVEMALSKLIVNIKNISIRIIMDHSTLDLEIKNGSLVTENGKRSIDLSEIILLSSYPNENPGEFEEKAEEKEEDNNNSDSESDDDNYEEMMQSSVLEKTKDLDNSLIYSKEDASSIYMSAASDTFQIRKKELSESTNLLSINNILISFNESLSIENLNVEIDTIKISATPLPLSVLHIIESLSILNPQDSRSSNLNKNIKKENINLIQSLIINEIEFNFVSALLSNGEFSVKNRLRLILNEVKFNSNDSNLLFGSISNFILLDNINDKIGYFNGDPNKNDIRFEKNLITGYFTLLLYKDLVFDFDINHIQKLISLNSLFPQIFESLNKLNSKPSVPIKSTNLIQTSNVEINLTLNTDIKIVLNISPISFDSNLGSLIINKIEVFKVENDAKNLISLISSLNYKIFKNEKQIKNFDNKGHELSYLTNSTLIIPRIKINLKFIELIDLKDSFIAFWNSLFFPEVKIYFKIRKKARISSNLAYSSRPSVKLNINLELIEFNLLTVNEKFGDLKSFFKNSSLLILKDNTLQFHIFKSEVSRVSNKLVENFFSIINPDDFGSPLISIKTNGFKIIDIFLRNLIINYFTEWLSILEDLKFNNNIENSEILNQSNDNIDEKMHLRFSLNDIAIGLNPGRLKAKSVLVITNGNLDILIEHQVTIKSELRSPSLHLIDDISNLLNHNDAKRNRNYNKSYSQGSYFNSKGFVSIAKSKNIALEINIKPFVDNQGISTKSMNFDLFTENLDLEFCADSFQCFISLVNDLKQPIVIKPESKYKINGEEIDVFNEIDLNAFNENSLEENHNFIIVDSKKDDPLNFVDNYYKNDENKSNVILDKSLSELEIDDKKNLSNNPYFSVQEAMEASINDQNDKSPIDSDSELLFEDDHFEEKITSSKSQELTNQFPMVLDLKISRVLIKIFDGYDWKYSRNTIKTAVKNLEKKVTEQQKLKAELLSRGLPTIQSPIDENNDIIGETLFESIHVSLPVDSEDPSKLISKINKDLQNYDDTKTIEFGKNNIKKLKLKRTKFEKVLIELNDLEVLFTIFSTQDPLSLPESKISESLRNDEFDIVNETLIKVANFEITDNVPTSTWNKFVTLLKEVEREEGSIMLSSKITTVRPIASSAATELIMENEILPLRLHVDQDTLEVLTRFGEFKDSRFQLIDEFEDIIYIQKFSINSVKVKLDYKPKKIDYAGLRSGHTTEFMNLFILDEASLVLKSVNLFGVPGFPRLNQLLNGLWMPDIKQTQLTGVISGLAPVRSIYNIGSNFKDLVVVPLNEYKKDGRVYRSVSKGVTAFGKNTTNELLKFGIKLANGTQALLENAEYALGGAGSAARVPVDLTTETIDEVSEGDIEDDDLSDGEDGRFGTQSQLIGRGSLSTQYPMSRSTFQPELESIADINQSRYSKPLNRGKRINEKYEEIEDIANGEDEAQQTISLYANQPNNLKEGLLLAYDSLGRNFLVAKDAIVNAGYEINEGGSAQSLTVAIAKATPIALLRPLIGATEATSRALYGINNELDPSSRKNTDDKYKQVNKK